MGDPSELSDFLTELSDALGRRLFVLDDRFRVVAYTFHQSEEERSRLSFVLAHSDNWYPLLNRVGDLHISTVPNLGVRVLVALHSEGRLVGYVLLILSDDEVMPPRELDLIKERAPRLALTLAAQIRHEEGVQARAKLLLQDLLGEDGRRRAAAAEALLHERLVGRASQYCAMVLAAPPNADSALSSLAARAAEVVLDYIRRFSTASVVGAGLDEGVGVLIFLRRVVRGRAERILDRADLRAVRVGIGPMVEGLHEVHRSYNRALDAWRVACMGAAGPAAAYWDDLGIDKILLRLPLDEITLEDLPAGLQRLLSSNLGEVFVHTLDSYLRMGGDAQQTARVLNIHRSTLYYRLGRIREVTESDLTDGLTRRELHTGLRVAELAGLL
ncbi:PucR family transcriptional regulator [Pseudarthrobacter phenanthrenivorans]|uniref:PucR family transcriptional regulator n=1 Tax=Pseudarthrobacter phenanthrenivorans TaxID=361575 RepID=UPI002F35A03D